LKLNTAQRLVLLDVLPKEGNYTTLKIVRKLKESLSFSEEEHKRLKFVQDGDGVRWDEKGEELKPIRRYKFSRIIRIL